YGEEGGYPGMDVPKDPRLDEARRRLKYQLVCVQRGLKGMTDLATGQPQAAEVQKIAGLFGKVMEATDPPAEKPTLEALAKAVRSASRELEAVTGVLGPREPEEEIDDSPVAIVPSPVPGKVPAKPVAPGVVPSKPAAPGGASRKPAAPGGIPSKPVAPGGVPAKPAVPAKP
ncbi:MAG: hypothetical protein ACC628_16415, partial [Pirellulaceae bacterium]